MNVCLGRLVAASLATATITCAPMPVDHGSEAAPARVGTDYGNVPMSFAANHGQTDVAVKFLARGQGYSLFLTSTEAVLGLRGASNEHAQPVATVRMRLVDANQQPELSGLDPLAGTSNFFIGNDPTRWQRDVPDYARVKYAGVYPGIDQIFYGNQRQLEYDFVVAAHADPGRIQLAFDGVETLTLDHEGNLVLQTLHGDVTQQKPVIYQDIDGRRQPVDGGYALGANSHVRFEIDAYDMRHPLVIDPVLSYATYLGGNSNDVGRAIAVDSAGNAYITGETLSTNFPGAGASPIQSSKWASYDVFVTKLNAVGSAIVYSTYLGGSGGDYGYAIAVDDTGNAYVTGQTDSPTVDGPGNVPFPVIGGVQSEYKGGGDAFITKIDASGNALTYSTYLGGSGVERGDGIAVDTDGNAYVTGHTNSINGPGTFPIVNPLQSDNGGNYDAFVTKIDAQGSSLVYSTYLGGDDSEYSNSGGAIAVDSAGNAYVAGSTRSLGFPGAKTLQTSNGGEVDGFVVKFNAAGSALLYSTYLGGSGYDEINGLAINAGGDAFVVGYTDSTNFPISAALQPSKGTGNDAFVSRLDAAGSALVFSTYLGGSGGDIAYHVTIDSASNAYVAGWTQSSNFPIAQPFQTDNFGSGDAFVSALTAAGSGLVYSSRMGGSVGSEFAYGVAVDSASNVYVTGQTNSTNFPTANAVQPALGTPGTDAFVVRITAPAPTVLGPPTNLLATSIAGNTVTLNWTAPANSITPTGYVLEGGVSPGETLASIATNTPAPTFTFVAPTGAFYIRMQSVAGGITSGASNEIRIFVNLPAPPSAPANLLALVNGNDLSLAWTNTAGGGIASGLFLDVSGSLAATLSIAAADAFSFANVPAGTYTLSLRAFNGTGVSGSSNSVTLTFPGVCSGAPATPESFVTSKSGNTISASWGLPATGPAPTGYIVNVSGAFVGAFAVQARSLAGAVAPGSYTLTVTATNACGTGVASSPQTVTIP